MTKQEFVDRFSVEGLWSGSVWHEDCDPCGGAVAITEQACDMDLQRIIAHEEDVLEDNDMEGRLCTSGAWETFVKSEIEDIYDGLMENYNLEDFLQTGNSYL